MAAKPILAGVDGSPWSRAALAFAAWLATSTGSRLLIAKAVQPVDSADGEERFRVDSFASVQASLQQELHALAGVPKDAFPLVLAGEPVRCLLEAVADYEPWLVAVGARGYREFDSWILGSVADKLARTAPVPVLIVPNTRWEPPAAERRLRILVATPAGEESPTTWAVVRMLPQKALGETTLLELGAGGMPQVTSGARLASRHVLLTINAAAPADVGSQPARALADFAADQRFDLTVVARHQQMLLEETLAWLLRVTRTPLIVAPPA